MTTINDVLAQFSHQGGAAKYPTKEEILDANPKHKADVIDFVKMWKKSIWMEARKLSTEVKFNALKDLIQTIAEEHYDKPVDVVYQADAPSCAYNPLRNVVIINQTLSIISALHELAHHLFGPSEKKACIWSVHLFRKTFPTAYKALHWNGHMLVRNNPEACSQ